MGWPLVTTQMGQHMDRGSSFCPSLLFFSLACFVFAVVTAASNTWRRYSSAVFAWDYERRGRRSHALDHAPLTCTVPTPTARWIDPERGSRYHGRATEKRSAKQKPKGQTGRVRVHGSEASIAYHSIASLLAGTYSLRFFLLVAG
jgi:hypothetical protein